MFQEGNGDGVTLQILNNDGTIRHWDLFEKWINGNDER